MNCNDYQDQISAYLDRELSGDEQSSLTRHLDGCPLCQSEMRALLAIKGAVRAQILPAIPPELIAQIESHTVFKSERSWNWADAIPWVPWAFGAAAVGIWALLVLGNVRLQMHESTTPLQTLMARRDGSAQDLHERVASHRVVEPPPDAPDPQP